MRHALTLFLLFAAFTSGGLASAKDAPTPADRARHLLRSGKAAEAAEIYAATAKTDPAAAIGLARCKAAQGKPDEAIRLLHSCPKPTADAHAELAWMLFRRGDHPGAAEAVERALKLNDSQLLARWIQAELHRVAGRLDEATEAYSWLVRYYNENEVTDAESLRWIGLAAAQHARWNRLSDQFSFLVNELYPDALRREPDFWPARYEAGVLYLEKYNQADALREFNAALALNPRAAEVHAALASLRIVARDVDEAKASVRRALELDPTLLEAWQLEADFLWDNFQVREAAELLEKKALPLNPVDESTLGRLAACHVLLDTSPATPSRLTRLIDQVNARNPRAGEFHLILGAALADRHKSALAQRYLNEAQRRMPQLVETQTLLALLHMQDGREKEARPLLEKAFDADPFNVRTSNMLQLFEVLDRMKTVETKHVILKYDGRQDALLGRYAAEYLDEIYPQLCERFGYTPPGKPLIEVFHKAEGASGVTWFAARMTGLPYIGTVAASSGKIVGMASPNDPVLAGKYDWARVLRHELTHVVTLQQTDFDIPHWYTEALAVDAEASPRPQRWNDLLLERVPRGKLYDLETINAGFARPGSGDDWQMAYCQAKLYLDYMREAHPNRPAPKLLAAYAQGLSTRDAIQKAFGVSQETFEKGYREYLKKVVQGLSSLRRARPGRSLKELLKQHKADPKNIDLAAEAALAQLNEGDPTEARALAQAILDKNPKHQLAAYVLARLELTAKRRKEAVALLATALDPNDPQAETLNLLAGLKLKDKNHAEAARLFGLGRQREPNNPEWLKALARVHLLSGDKKELYAVLAQFAETGEADAKVFRKLAELAADRADHEAAGRWALEGIRLDVEDADLHAAFARSAAARHNEALAVAEYRVAVALRPDSSSLRMELARTYLAAHRPDDARRALDALLRRRPNDRGAKEMAEKLKTANEPERKAK